MWLRKYLDEKSKVQNKRIDNINDKTKKFQTLLMRTSSTETPAKANTANTGEQVFVERTEIPENLKFYRKTKPKAIKASKGTPGAEDIGHKSHRAYKQTDFDEHRLKEIHGHMHSPNMWLTE